MPVPAPERSDSREWQHLLLELDKASLQPRGSKQVIIDGITRIVSDSYIAIIKRNEQRLWTRSAAREDAEAALVQAILRQDAANQECR